MTAKKYRQITADENSLGLHYSRFHPTRPTKSTACNAKIQKPKVESAKIG
jgi:hypothetical protein